MKTKKIPQFLVSIITVLVLGGCATAQPQWQHQVLGGAVASVVDGQIANPDAAAEPGDQPIVESDGNKTKKVVDAWRESVSAPQASTGDIVINVGQ